MMQVEQLPHDVFSFKNEKTGEEEGRIFYLESGTVFDIPCYIATRKGKHKAFAEIEDAAVWIIREVENKNGDKTMNEQKFDELQEGLTAAGTLLSAARNTSLDEVGTMSTGIEKAIRILRKVQELIEEIQSESQTESLSYRDALRAEIPLSLFSLRETTALDEWDFLTYWLARVADYVAWKIDWVSGARSEDLEADKERAYRRLLEMIFGHDGESKPYHQRVKPSYESARNHYGFLRTQSHHLNLPVAVVTLGELMDLCDGEMVLEEMAVYCALQALEQAGDFPVIEKIANLAFGRRAGAPNPSGVWCKEAKACSKSLNELGVVLDQNLKIVLTRRIVSDSDASAWITLRFYEPL